MQMLERYGVATPNVKNRTLSACGSLRRALDSVLGLTNLLIASLPARNSLDLLKALAISLCCDTHCM
jgi:hypothetical protein